MTTTREENYNKGTQLSDGAIMDLMNYKLCGSLGYHDKIVAMIAQGHKNDKMVLEFKHYDLPDELLDMFWKFGEAERIIECAKKQTQEIFEYVHKKAYEENYDIHYDEIDFKLVVDDDKLVSSFVHAKNERVLNKDLVVIDGIVISKSDVVPEIVKNVYRCQACHHRYDSKIRECEICESKNIQRSIPDCKVINREYLTIQEHQKDMKPGETEPETMEVVCYGSLIKNFYPGNYVRVTGFPRIEEKKGGLYIIMKAHNIQHTKTPLEILISDPRKLLSEKDEKAIQGIRKRYNDLELLNVLVNSFTPNVHGMEAIKEALLLQAVGGSKIEIERDRIHILVIGDPGLAKSKLADEYRKILMHVIMAVGYGTSGVGLTVSIINVNGLPRASIGAAVLAHNGILILDELGGVNDANREHLRQCMEGKNGIISINKHGINLTFNANISLLAITNPDSGRYSKYNSLTENIKISPPLLSRFDLIFVLIDDIDEYEDQKLNIHTTARWNETKPPDDFILSNDSIDTDLLRKYLVYAKINNQKVRISETAYKRFDNFYRDLRKPERSSDITATRRQYDGIYRIATAMARLLLKSEVTEEIAEYTIKLLNTAYESTGMKLGNSTGLNQTTIYSKPLNEIHPHKAFNMVMRNLTKENTVAIEKEAVMLELRDKALMPIEDAYSLWDKMDKKGALMVENGRFYKLNYDNLLS